MVDQLIKDLVYRLKIKKPEKFISSLENMNKEIDKIWENAKLEFQLHHKDSQ